MMIRNCMTIVANEAKSNKGMFSFYLIIFICLISIGTSILDVSFYLPERISTSVREMELDWLMVNVRHQKQLDKMTSLYDLECMDVYVNEFGNNTLGLTQAEESYSGGVLINNSDMQSILITTLENQLLHGEINNLANCFNQEEYNLYICETIAKKEDLDINKTVKLLGREGEPIVLLKIKGIYKDSEDLNDYYISQIAYEKYKEIYQNCSLELILRNIKSEEIFSFVDWMEEENIDCDYNEDMIGAIQMFYIFFSVFNFILLLALSGILYHLLEIYMLKRTTFYAMGLAMGMTEIDIMRILYVLAELLISIAMVGSMIGSVLVLASVNKVANELFSFSEQMYIPVLALVMNWCILQVCMIVVMKCFWKKINGKEIIQMLNVVR